MGNFSRKKVLQLAKGFRGRAKSCYSLAIRGVHKALQHAYVGRKLKKRTMRTSWIVTLNAGLREHRIKYSQFIHGQNMGSNIILDRKILAELVRTEPFSFKAVVDEVALQAGVPRIELPRGPNYEEAKKSGDIIDKPYIRDPVPKPFMPIRLRPGVDPRKDFLRLSYIDDDAEWRKKLSKYKVSVKEMKRMQKKMVEKPLSAKQVYQTLR